MMPERPVWRLGQGRWPWPRLPPTCRDSSPVFQESRRTLASGVSCRQGPAPKRWVPAIRPAKWKMRQTTSVTRDNISGHWTRGLTNRVILRNLPPGDLRLQRGEPGRFGGKRQGCGRTASGSAPVSRLERGGVISITFLDAAKLFLGLWGPHASSRAHAMFFPTPGPLHTMPPHSRGALSPLLTPGLLLFLLSQLRAQAPGASPEAVPLTWVSLPS